MKSLLLDFIFLVVFRVRKWLMRIARLKTFPFLVTFILLLTLFFISLKCSLFYLNSLKMQGLFLFGDLSRETVAGVFRRGDDFIFGDNHLHKSR